MPTVTYKGPSDFFVTREDDGRALTLRLNQPVEVSEAMVKHLRSISEHTFELPSARSEKAKAESGTPEGSSE